MNFSFLARGRSKNVALDWKRAREVVVRDWGGGRRVAHPWCGRVDWWVERTWGRAMGIRGRVLEVGGSGAVLKCCWSLLLLPVWNLGLRRSD